MDDLPGDTYGPATLSESDHGGARVHIPPEVLEAAGLEPGEMVLLDAQDGRLRGISFHDAVLGDADADAGDGRAES